MFDIYGHHFRVYYRSPKPPVSALLSMAVLDGLVSHDSEKFPEFKTGLFFSWVEGRAYIASGQRGPSKAIVLSKRSQTGWFHSCTPLQGATGSELREPFLHPTSSLGPLPLPAGLGWAVGEDRKWRETRQHLRAHVLT